MVGNTNLNMDMNRAGLKRMLEIDELEELRNDAYFNSKIAKDKQKKWHDQFINRRFDEAEVLPSKSEG